MILFLYLDFVFLRVEQEKGNIHSVSMSVQHPQLCHNAACTTATSLKLSFVHKHDPKHQADHQGISTWY